MGRPQMSVSLSLPGRALSSRARAAVLVSVQTMACITKKLVSELYKMWFLEIAYVV